MSKKKILIIPIVIIIFFVIASGFDADNKPESIPEPVNKSVSNSQDWKEIWLQDKPQTAQGWGEPVLLEVNLDDWGDSLWVTPNGQTIYFMWIEGDPFTTIVLEGGNVIGNPDIYRSEEPFVTKQKDTRFYFDEDPYGAAGPMFDDNGDVWYMSNREYIINQKVDTDIYMNYDMLPFNNDEQYVNPHYCVSKDELWFDRDDTEIFVLENAKENGFAGTPKLALEPINDANPASKESQPWLSSDCNTMYFSSTRDHLESGPYIYMSERINDSWTTPVPIIFGVDIAVGEPSLTNDGEDGAKLFYEQIIKNDQDVFTTIFFCIEKD